MLVISNNKIIKLEFAFEFQFFKFLSKIFIDIINKIC